MNQTVTDAKLRELVRFAAPDDGAFRFRVFRIPPAAREMELVEDGRPTRMPLRCKPGDVRCGLAVADRGGVPIYVTAIEMDGALPFAEIESNVTLCFDTIMRELKADGF